LELRQQNNRPRPGASKDKDKDKEKNKDQETFVGNRRRFVNNQSRVEKKKFFEERKVGEVVEGVVKNITEYGAFIGINGVDALLHIKDISWTKTTDVKDVLKTGDVIKVKIIAIDLENNKIAVGLKQLAEDPWTSFINQYKIEDVLTGTISNIQEYGAFVKLIDGVDGFVHISDLSWTKNFSNPNEIIKVGQKIEVKILDIDTVKKKVSLGVKHLLENPWDKAFEKYAEGTVANVTVKSITSFGLFVELEDSIDALLHSDDISWTERVDLNQQFKIGDKLDVKVIGFDTQKRKIKVGLKQMQDNPWDKLDNLIDKKTNTLECEVLSVDENNGLYVLLTDDIKTYIPLKEIGYGRVSENKATINSDYKKGQKVKALVVDLDKNKRTILLSIRALLAKEEKKKVAEFLHNESDSMKFTIGDMLKTKDK